MEDSGQVMIGFLEGKLRAKSPEYVIVDVHGVGYHVQVPLSTFYDLPELGQPVGLNIHTLRARGRHSALRLSHDGRKGDVPAPDRRERSGAKTGR